MNTEIFSLFPLHSLHLVPPPTSTLALTTSKQIFLLLLLPTLSLTSKAARLPFLNLIKITWFLCLRLPRGCFRVKSKLLSMVYRPGPCLSLHPNLENFPPYYYALDILVSHSLNMPVCSLLRAFSTIIFVSRNIFCKFASSSFNSGFKYQLLKSKVWADHATQTICCLHPSLLLPELLSTSEVILHK